MEDISKNICEEKALALRKDLHNNELGHLPRVLASLGWSWSEHASNFERIVREADANMYLAKQEDKTHQVVSKQINIDVYVST